MLEFPRMSVAIQHSSPTAEACAASTPPRIKSELRGYVRGSRAAAVYCGVDRKTFRSWRDDPAQSEMLRKLLKPRVIRGESYYRLSNLDRFMDPANNVDEEPTFFA